MKILDKLKNIFCKIEDTILLEHSCIVCSREIPDGTHFQICEDCYKNLKWIDGRTCAKCGDKLKTETTMVCDNCKDIDYAFDSNTSCVYYDQTSATIVKSLKYGSKKYYAKHIAEIMGLQKEAFKDIDVITFIPISKSRRRKRGFNQAELIATKLGEMFNIPVLNFLVKVFDGKNQAKLNRTERLKNLVGCFELASENADKIKGKNILVIDDVFTTGATLNESSKVLKTKKPKSVHTLTFAKTDFHASNFYN